jgi:hypothetical protein
MDAEEAILPDTTTISTTPHCRATRVTVDAPMPLIHDAGTWERGWFAAAGEPPDALQRALHVQYAALALGPWAVPAGAGNTEYDTIRYDTDEYGKPLTRTAYWEYGRIVQPRSGVWEQSHRGA